MKQSSLLLLSILLCYATPVQPSQELLDAKELIHCELFDEFNDFMASTSMPQTAQAHESLVPSEEILYLQLEPFYLCPDESSHELAALLDGYDFTLTTGTAAH